MTPISDNNIELAINILVKAYYNNPGTTLIVGNKGNKRRRLKLLMRYAICKSMRYNGAFLSEDKNGVLLYLYPKRNYITLRLLLFEIILLFSVIGFKRIIPTLKREKLLQKNHPNFIDYKHVWFLGVDPAFQRQQTGTKLMKLMITKNQIEGLNIIVETLEKENFYRSLGFEVLKRIENSTLNYSFLIYRIK